MRVQIPAYTDHWMRGDRYGEVVRIDRHIVAIKGDRITARGWRWPPSASTSQARGCAPSSMTARRCHERATHPDRNHGRLDQSLETIREWIEAAQIDDDEYEKRSDLVNRMETRFAALRGALP